MSQESLFINGVIRGEQWNLMWKLCHRLGTRVVPTALPAIHSPSSGKRVLFPLVESKSL